jgi:hypothetical protein
MALYFACSAGYSDDARLWAIAAFRKKPKSDLNVLDLDLDVLELDRKLDEKQAGPITYFDGPSRNSDAETNDAVKILYPLYNSPRIIAQDGVFTLHSSPTSALEHYGSRKFDKSRLDVQYLYRRDVPKSRKRSLVHELDNVGISRRTVFPDLDGIAGGLWETEVMWNGERQATSALTAGPKRKSKHCRAP